MCLLYFSVEGDPKAYARKKVGFVVAETEALSPQEAAVPS